jgi:hypothetical protein
MLGETQLTSGRCGRVLTNVGVWSPDGRWIVYDTRSDPAGDVFDGTRIEMVNVHTREVRTLYESRDGACCGVATWHPRDMKVVFILGPERPTPDWSYGPSRRQGVIVYAAKPGLAVNLDARDLVPPFTPGALRGGSHVHVFSPDGEWVSFTYEDQVLTRFADETADHDTNLRNVGVGVPAGVVRVGRRHARNHDGTYFSVLVTRTTANPSPGSDEISKAFEEAWVGSAGYLKPDGRRQRRALAFQGHVADRDGRTVSEVFVADLPDDVRVTGTGPLQGTTTRRPSPPRGTAQRRLTFTTGRKYPGLQGPRHWLRSSPDGKRIGFLMKVGDGVPQLWTVSPNGGDPVQLTNSPSGVGSAFTWSTDSRRVTFVTGNRVAVVDTRSGMMAFVTDRRGRDESLRPEACVFSPDGRRVAFVVRPAGIGAVNQIHVAAVPA